MHDEKQPEASDLLYTICSCLSVAILLLVLGFNNTSTLVGHFVSSPRKREKRDKRDSRGDEREGQGRKRTRMKVKKQKK